jgi:hypothetical protein
MVSPVLWVERTFLQLRPVSHIFEVISNSASAFHIADFKTQPSVDPEQVGSLR